MSNQRPKGVPSESEGKPVTSNQKTKSRKPFLATRYLPALRSFSVGGLLASLILVWLILPQAVCLGAPYTLSITANNGSVRVNPDKPLYDEAEVVELIPKPDTGYCFKSWAGDAQSKRLVLTLTMDSDKDIIANFETWKPPIGIPMPEFGIFETYRMYDEPANRNPALTYTQNAEGGYYTHYIDNTHPNATDTSNPYGTAERPRLGIPRDLPEGSVVEVHNSANSNGWDKCNITGVGTAEKPIFVRGINMPRIPLYMDVGLYGNTKYLIVEGISFFNGLITGRASEGDVGEVFDNSYIAVRNSDFHGDENGGGVEIRSRYANFLHHVVFYNNVVHDNGIWDPLIATGDRDIGHVKVWSKTSYVWAVDNETYHNESDGLTSGTEGPGLPTTHHIFFGRNIAHHNKQSGLWAKEADDVIYSENEVYGIRASSSSPGEGMGFHAGTERIWFLFNKIHDCEYGINVASDQGWGSQIDSYYIGNLIYDIHYDPAYHSTPYNPNSGYSSAGITTWGGRKKYFIGNTIYDADAGINIVTDEYEYAYFADNLISNIGTQGQKHIWIAYWDGWEPWEASNNLLYQPGGSGRIGRSHTVYTTSTLPLEYGSNNIDADPQFVDALNNDFHLQSTSPAIDAGIESEVYQRFYELYGIDIRKDIEARTRPQGSGWDIGAYEYAPQGALLYGDVTGDGTISATDASRAARYAVGLISLTEIQVLAADVTGKAGVTATDAAWIARKAVGLVDKFPVEQ